MAALIALASMFALGGLTVFFGLHAYYFIDWQHGKRRKPDEWL